MTLILSGTDGLSDVDGSAATPAIKGTDANTGIFFPAADTVGVSTGGSERVRVDSSGNVGIGTSSPSSYGRLAVMTPTANYGYFGIANSAGGAGGVNMAQYYGTTKISYIDTTLTNGTPGSETAFLAFATANSGTLAERMRIDSSGNVGIGTSSPSVKLEVSGPVYSAQNNYIRIGNAYLSSGGDYCHLANNTYFNGSVWTSSANGAMYQMTGQTHNWYTQTSNAFTAVAVITSTGNFQFNSGYGSVATAYGCRAWVNFNGTGTVAIRASGNVSSITDIGVGDYTVNFTNAMPDANYAFAGSAAANYANNLTLYIGQDSNDTRSTTQLNFKTIYNNANTAAPDDSPNVNVAVYR